VKREKFHWLPLASKGLPSIGGLPLLGKEVFTGILMQSYPPMALDRRLQEDWAKDEREGHRVLMSLTVNLDPWAKYEPNYLCIY